MKWLTPLMIMLIAGCQTPISSGSQCIAPDGFLAERSPYAWRLETALDLDDPTGYVSPLIVKQIEDAVREELSKKGLEYLDRNADPNPELEVALTLKTRRELIAFESNGSLCRYSDCWERIDMGSQVRMETRTIGFLASDIYFKGDPVWRGWVETPLFPKDRDAAHEVIARAIPELFKTFPR